MLAIASTVHVVLRAYNCAVQRVLSCCDHYTIQAHAKFDDGSGVHNFLHVFGSTWMWLLPVPSNLAATDGKYECSHTACTIGQELVKIGTYSETSNVEDFYLTVHLPCPLWA